MRIIAGHFMRSAFLQLSVVYFPLACRCLRQCVGAHLGSRWVALDDRAHCAGKRIGCVMGCAAPLLRATYPPACPAPVTMAVPPHRLQDRRFRPRCWAWCI